MRQIGSWWQGWLNLPRRVQHDALVQEELHGFGNALVASLRNINSITAVVLGGSDKILAMNAIRRPGETSGGGLRDEHLGARRRKWIFVKIKSTIELVLGREARFDARGM